MGDYRVIEEMLDALRVEVAIWRKLNLELLDENKALREGLDRLLELITNANEGAFKNGVTDSTGAIDEGEVRASEYIDSAYALLQDNPK